MHMHINKYTIYYNASQIVYIHIHPISYQIPCAKCHINADAANVQKSGSRWINFLAITRGQQQKKQSETFNSLSSGWSGMMHMYSPLVLYIWILKKGVTSENRMDCSLSGNGCQAWVLTMGFRRGQANQASNLSSLGTVPPNVINISEFRWPRIYQDFDQQHWGHMWEWNHDGVSNIYYPLVN